MAKKILAVILTVTIAFGVIPVHATAATERKLIETRFIGAQVREKAKSNSSLIAWCKQGELMEYVGVTYNLSGKWYKVKHCGKTGYIHTNHGKIHEHVYASFSISDIAFEICDCGEVEVNARTAEKQKIGNMLKNTALLSVPFVNSGVVSSSNSLFVAAPVIAGADGLLPVGDIIAVGLLILGGYMALNTTLPSAKTLAQHISEVDFDNFLDENAVACGRDTFRKVERVNGKLKYVDKRCMDKYQAYVYVRILKKDVYTPYEDVALQLATMHAMQGGAVKFERDKDEDTYFFHYHLGKLKGSNLKDFDRVTKGHIFYGTNDNGDTPIE